ncbi:MAG: N-acetylglucosamine-6-phosphate deacetylase [Acidimicrobiales bacterium]
MATRLTAAQVLRPDGTLRPGTLIIDGERIAAVEELGPHEAAPERTLSPGLVDLQINGLGTLSVAGGTAADLYDLGTTLARRGTTAWCPTLTSQTLGWYEGWFASHDEPAPGEVGIHLEGPFLAHPGAHPLQYLRPPDRAWLADLPGRVCLMTLAPELPGGLEAISQLAARGVVASLGHTDAAYEVAVAAADAGATMVTHVFNGMGPLHHRDPGVVAAALTDDRLVPGVIGDGVHVHPIVVRLILETTRAALVSDSVAFPATDDGARLPDGTLAGSVITMADAVRRAVMAGIPLGLALTAATATPADVLGRADLGVLAPGARADVIAWNADLAIEDVWVSGRRVA